MARTKNRFNAIGKKAPSVVEPATVYRVALYARISTEIAEKPSESIENQLALMKRFIGANPELASYKEYVDRAYSGTNFHRPAFQEMMEEAKAGRINCIIVKDLSRLGRDYLETCNLIEVIFPFLGIRFISVNDNFDTNQDTNGNKELEIALKNMVNDMYAKDISKRVSGSRRLDIERGKFTGSNAPYGYKVDNNHPLRRFIVDPEAAQVVRDIYEMALEGMPLIKISLELQRRNLTIPGMYHKNNHLYQEAGDERKIWRVGTLSTMLKNQAYIGNLVQGKNKTRLCDGDKRTRLPSDEWVVVENAHEPIVTKEMFYQVQQIMEKKVEESTFAVSRTDELPIEKNKYAGILYCGICGARMAYSYELRGGRRNYYYSCSNDYQLGKEKCRNRITLKTLDKAVMKSITSIYKQAVKASPDADIKSIYTKKLKQEEVAYEKIKVKFYSQVNTLENEISAAYEDYVAGLITSNDFITIRNKKNQSIQQVKEDASELEKQFMHLQKEIQSKMNWISFLSEGSNNLFLSVGILNQLIRRIDVQARHMLEIEYKFSKPEGGQLWMK